MDTEPCKLLGRVEKRLTVIGEWQGDQACTRQPTAYDTAQDCCGEGGAGRTGGKRDGLISVRGLQRIQPPSRMEHRCLGMLRNKFRPSVVPEWIDGPDAVVR